MDNKLINQIYDINEPDKLLVYIHNNLAPKKIEKKELGEVFTDMRLVNEMLDKLPISVWKNKDLKWLDPATGIGNYPIAIYLRLMIGLKETIEDEEERKKHILEKMLYMVEINKNNVSLLKKILCGMNYNLNVFEGSFLDYKSDIIFDIIVGNPPYQNIETNGKKRKGKDNNQWSIFVHLSFNSYLKNDGFLLFITPYSWMSLGFAHKDIFYKNYVIYLNIKECEKYFKGVGSTFSYYLIQKTDKKKETEVKCLYRNVLYNSRMLIPDNTDFLPLLLSKEGLSILYKFYNNDIDKISFLVSGELDTRSKKRWIGKHDDVFKYPILHTSSYKDTLYSSIKHSLSDKHKILLCLSGYPSPFYDDGVYGITEARFYLLTNNRDYINVLNSKLYKFVFLICKWSGFNVRKLFKNIPYIEEFISDDHLYLLFNLNDDEISLINSVILK